MNYLSLFSGAAGGDLGLQQLLKWKCRGYVEINQYCQKVLIQRQKDGLLDIGPIFPEIGTFVKAYADCFKGMVEVVSAGFPCQPFSIAGHRKGEADERNMWPATKDCIGIIRPRYCFLENVPGLLIHKYIQRIFGDLASMGYDCKWGTLCSSQSGATTKRERLWIVGHDSKFNVDRLWVHKGADFKVKFWRPEPQGDLSNVETSWLMANGYGARDIDETPNRMDRIKAIGNAQMPNMATTAWNILTKDL